VALGLNSKEVIETFHVSLHWNHPLPIDNLAQPFRVITTPAVAPLSASEQVFLPMGIVYKKISNAMQALQLKKIQKD
jgi:hypothetical protein